MSQARCADERLRLIFTCCHPALAFDAQVTLTLRTLGGLTTPEIARAFLTSESTMAQRLVRAKNKIRALDMPVLDEVFEMSRGYVLNFSDRTFAEFFYDELGISIDDPCYAQQGESKGKRLRFFITVFRTRPC